MLVWSIQSIVLLPYRTEGVLIMAMNLGVLFERVQDAKFPAGYHYAHIPTLGLTTHGLGLEGARQAALDLARLWLDEKAPLIITAAD
jgi:hypothetical protein